jgi:hypothetical protein
MRIARCTGLGGGFVRHLARSWGSLDLFLQWLNNLLWVKGPDTTVGEHITDCLLVERNPPCAHNLCKVPVLVREWSFPVVDV